jgi:hypothetical protein
LNVGSGVIVASTVIVRPAVLVGPTWIAGLASGSRLRSPVPGGRRLADPAEVRPCCRPEARIGCGCGDGDPT